MPKSKQQKQLEAQERQDKYNKLSTTDKLKLLESRRGNSLKETMKLKTGVKFKTVKQDETPVVDKKVIKDAVRYQR